MIFHRVLFPLVFLALISGPASLAGAAPLTVVGSGFHIGTLGDGVLAYDNRDYTLEQVSPAINGWQITELGGGKGASVRVWSSEDCTLYVATGSDVPTLAGWQRHDDLTFGYTDKKRTRMYVYSEPYTAGTTVIVPQQSWTGTMVLAPTLVRPDVSSPAPGAAIIYNTTSTGSYVVISKHHDIDTRPTHSYDRPLATNHKTERLHAAVIDRPIRLAPHDRRYPPAMASRPSPAPRHPSPHHQ